MCEIAIKPNGHVLVLADECDAFEEEVTKDYVIPQVTKPFKLDEEASLDGMLALAVFLAVVGGFWNLIVNT